MIRCNIQEDADLRFKAFSSIELVAADLNDIPVKLLRGYLTCHAETYVACQPYIKPGFLHQMVCEQRCRRLAIGTGDCDDLRIRMTESKLDLITNGNVERCRFLHDGRLIRNSRALDDQFCSEHFIYYSDDQVIAKEIKTRSVVPLQVPVSLKGGTGVHYDGSKMVFDLKEKFSIAQSDTTLKGPHNLINTMAAVSAVYLAGASLDSIRRGLKTFVNAPHRLELVGRIRGVEFINDSKATNVDTVVYALGSYDRPLVWIAGGIDKGNDYNLIKDEVKKKVRALICLGKDNEKLKKAFGDVVPVIRETQSVKELVKMALDLAKEGDVVLLSPACASFDLFKNYEDRGDQFRSAVRELEV